MKTKSQLKFYGSFIVVILVVLGWVVFFNYVSPTAVVEKIGIHNSYLVAFFLAVICGFSSLTGTTFYVAIAALAHGGVNPALLGIIGGLGLCISDAAFFYVISKGTHVIDKHWESFSNFLKKHIKSAPDWLLYLFVFIYSGFIPIPNDVMLVTLAIGGTKFKKFAPYLFAGDIVSTLLLSYVAR